VTQHASPPLPEWVHQRDGRLVPFDADRISRALFSATESQGRPDSFLARELTGSVVHFLRIEAEGTTPTTTQIAELIVKVVRELGHPTLAQAYATAQLEKEREVPEPATDRDAVLAQLGPNENSRALVQRLGAARVAPYVLRTIFNADVAWTHEEGLLSLRGLDAPLELAGWLLNARERRGLVEALEEARGIAGTFVAIDSPEYLLDPQACPGSAAEYVRELSIGLRATGLRAIVNLNGAAPPIWAGSLAEGPLFGGPRPAATPAVAPGRTRFRRRSARPAGTAGAASAGRRRGDVRLRPAAPAGAAGRGHGSTTPRRAAGGRPGAGALAPPSSERSGQGRGVPA
jgi:hypothetical protein